MSLFASESFLVGPSLRASCVGRTNQSCRSFLCSDALVLNLTGNRKFLILKGPTCFLEISSPAIGQNRQENYHLIFSMEGGKTKPNQSNDHNTDLLLGYGLVFLGFLMFVIPVYSLLISDFLPETGNPLLDFLKTD